MSSSPDVGPESGEVVVQVVAQTDVGRTREHNEDAFAVADLSMEAPSEPTETFTRPAGPRGALFMVADGMGGAAAGEIASAMAVEIVIGEMRANWTTSETTDADTFVRSIKQATKSANEHINSFATTHPEYRGMGTTATVAGFLGDTLYLAQVGDSRAYLVRNGSAQQITKDQSLMQKLIEAGELTEEEAAQSERRNIILQALGPEPIIKVDLTHQRVRRGDTLVLCSDGLSGQVTKDEIGVIVTEAPSLSEACKRLIDRANESGGPDNITVIVARFDGPGLQASVTEDEVGHRVFQLPDSGQTPTASFEGLFEEEVTAPFIVAGRPPSGPLRLGEPTTRQPPIVEIEEAPLPVVVSPERRNVGQLIAFALLALFILAAGWFIVRHTGGTADATNASAPKA
jgi:serine/threonine protein phosphatase PrpC